MKPFRALLFLAALASLAACSAVDEMVSRNMSPSMPLLGTIDAPHAPVPLHPSYKVVAVNVEVPETLKASELNSYKPRADIVWREDPFGDRHAQVDAIVTNALEKGVAGLNGGREVVLQVVITRFHALTQLTRYTLGGEHEIWMLMAVRDAKTGELLEPARRIGFNIHAAGGQEAIRNEELGITQKVVISNALADLIKHELTRPRDFLQG